MKIVNIFIFVLFAVFAVVQLNDPDPFLWFTIYLLVALIALLKIFGIFPRYTVRIFFILICAYALLHFPDFWYWLTHDNKSLLFGEMIYDKPHIEGTREFMGLSMAAIASGVQLLSKSDR